MKLQGTVQTGVGNAAFWLKKNADVYQLWTGMAIVPGSLNVELPEKFDWNGAEIAPFKKVNSLVPYGGNRDICLIPCEVYTGGSPRIYAFAWATTNAADAPEYKTLEIIADVNLRETLQLIDGAEVTIHIPLPWNI